MQAAGWRWRCRPGPPGPLVGARIGSLLAMVGTVTLDRAGATEAFVVRDAASPESVTRPWRVAAIEFVSGPSWIIESMNPDTDSATRVFGPELAVLRIGRAPDNEVVLHDTSVSMHHVELHRTVQGWLVRDIGSSNGTTLNGDPINGLSAARYGDTLQVGRTHLRLDADGVHELSAIPQIGRTMDHPSLGTARQGALPPQHGQPPSHHLSVPQSLGAGDAPEAGQGSPRAALDSPAGQLDQERPHKAADNSLVWALAFTPLLYLLVDAALGGTSPQSAAGWGLLVALVVNSTLVIFDRRRLPEAAKPNLWLGLALIPVYLFQRASRLRQTMVIPMVWCAAFAVALVLPLATGVGTHTDTHAVEQSIESGIQDQLGLTVTADCPDGIAVQPGSTFQCVVKAVDGTTAIADVTIQNSAGDVVWQIRN